MSLAKLWKENREQFESKNISQLVGLAGNGHLSDQNQTSEELRTLFDQVPSKFIEIYAEQCLTAFNQSGLVLQDLINQVGKRLGFNVTYGRYKGVKGVPGHDGLWIFPNGDHALIIEVKTTDTYRIDLDRIASYREQLNQDNFLPNSSSILLIVGREDTGGLESQVRGSRHAWDMRLISIDALIHLMKLKEEFDDPTTVNRIHNILVPREFTKLDEIIALLMLTASEVKQDEIPDAAPNGVVNESTPSSFHESCIRQAEKKLDVTFVKHSKSKYLSPDGKVAATCHVSKFYDRPIYQFWFAFHPHQAEFLQKSEESYVIFGCGSSEQMLIIPYADFRDWLDEAKLNTTERTEGIYFHIQIAFDDEKFLLIRKRGIAPIDITQYSY
jgi:hypothetical protein